MIGNCRYIEYIMINLNTRQQINASGKVNSGSFFKKLKSNLKIMDPGAKALYLAFILIFFGMVSFSLVEYLGNRILRADDFLLPDKNPIVESSLLEYASAEFTGMGSGISSIQESSIITTVKAFDYEVKPGDTLSGISKTYNIDVGTLISYNKIEDVRRIWVGAKLKIPDIDGLPYVVRGGDSLESIAEKHGVPLNDILDANNLDSEIITAGDQLFIPGARISEYDYKKATGTLFLYPTSGRLSSPYGYRIDPFTGVRRMHYGLDIANRTGTDIRATMAGTVVVVGDQPQGYGNYVVIRHSRGFQSLYGHMDTVLVRKGQRVSQGQKIGRMGNSGRSTGSHLHFSLYRNNVPVDPLNGYLYR